MECCGDTTKSFKWITPASHRVGTRQAECNCAKWVYSTWEWLERLFCTHQCPNRWSTLYNKKRLVNFNCPLNQDPFGCEIGDCSEIGISVYPANPATRSYPELPGVTLVSAVRLSCWHLEAHLGSWCRHFCCNLASRWASRTTETRWDEINRVNIGVPRCSTFTA